MQLVPLWLVEASRTCTTAQWQSALRCRRQLGQARSSVVHRWRLFGNEGVAVQRIQPRLRSSRARRRGAPCAFVVGIHPAFEGTLLGNAEFGMRGRCTSDERVRVMWRIRVNGCHAPLASARSRSAASRAVWAARPPRTRRQLRRNSWTRSLPLPAVRLVVAPTADLGGMPARPHLARPPVHRLGCGHRICSFHPTKCATAWAAATAWGVASAYATASPWVVGHCMRSLWATALRCGHRLRFGCGHRTG